MKPRRSFFGALALGLFCTGLLAAPTSPTSPPTPRPPAKAKPVDLNNASRAELMALPGVGAAEAERIVRGRPWLSKASLVSGQVLPAATYDGLRGRIFVGAPKRSKGGPAR